MFYYIAEYLKWITGRPLSAPKPSSEEHALSEIIRKRAEEQNAIIERKKDENVVPPEPPAKVAEKDFFE
jgi:hypothetical protein